MTDFINEGEREHRLRYGLDGLFACDEPPDAGRPVSVHDVVVSLLHRVDGDVEVTQEYRQHPPAGCGRFEGTERIEPGPFDLSEGFSIHQIDSQSKLISQGVRPRGHFYWATGNDPMRYQFKRDMTHTLQDESRLVPWLNFDADSQLQMTVALSRLIRDNATGLGCAGRVIEFESGEFQIIPRTPDQLSHAFRIPLVERDWLDEADAEALKELIGHYRWARRELPTRLSRAFSRSEYATHTMSFQQAIGLMVSAIEALTLTWDRRLTRSFKQRLSRLAEDHEIEGLDAALAGRVYAMRSQGVHGRDPTFEGDLPEDVISDFRLTQKTLRATIRKAIEDPEYRAHFETNETIDALFA